MSTYDERPGGGWASAEPSAPEPTTLSDSLSDSDLSTTGTDVSGTDYADTDYASTDYTGGSDYSTDTYSTDTFSSSTDQSTTQTAKEQAGLTAGSAMDAAGQVVGATKEQAGQVAGEVKNQVRDLAGEARTQVNQQAGTQRDKAVGSLRQLGDQLSSMADKSDDNGIASELARQASSRAHDVAGFLDNKEPGDILEEVKTFARRRPGAFILGAAVAGLLAGRVTRGVVASHQEDSPTHEDAPTSGTYGTGRYAATDTVPAYSDSTYTDSTYSDSTYADSTPVVDAPYTVQEPVSSDTLLGEPVLGDTDRETVRNLP